MTGYIIPYHDYFIICIILFLLREISVIIPNMVSSDEIILNKGSHTIFAGNAKDGMPLNPDSTGRRNSAMQQSDREEAVESIRKIQKGDKAEFSHLIEAYHPYLTADVWRMAAGALPKEDVEDVIQETWTELCVRIANPEKQQYDPSKASFRTYLANISKYRILSRMSCLKKVFIPKLQDSTEDFLKIIENLPDADEYIPEKIVMEKAEKKLRFEAYLQLLKLVFLCGGYPHQQLAFVFAKLLHGKQSARALEGKVEVIYTELGLLPLSDVLAKAKAAMCENTDSSAAHEAVSLVHPLTIRLILTLDRLMQSDRPSRVFYRGILQKTAKDTCFKDYYSISSHQEDENNKVKISNTVSNWIYKLEQNVKRQIGINDPAGKQASSGDEDEELMNEPADRKIEDNRCNRCRFRTIPPCAEKTG